MNLGIIPCDNGLGHIFRSIELANILSKKFKVTLYLSKNSKHFLIDRKVSIKKISTNFKLLRNNNYNTNWYKNIKQEDLKKIDILISDNLPEAVFLNKKIILYANFFWHEIFNKNNHFIRLLKREIIKRNVKILSNYLFSNITYFKKNIHKIGFIGKYRNQNISKKKGILISLGNSKIGYKNNFEKSLKVLKNPKFNKYIFYLDRNLFKKKKIISKNVRIANFSNEMFEDIKIAIIKPGFGTIQDCLKRGIAINSFLQSNNKEFLHNAKILKKKKIGDYYFSLNSALNNAIYKFNDNKKIIKIQKICKKLSWEGEKNFQKHILKTTIYN